MPLTVAIGPFSIFGSIFSVTMASTTVPFVMRITCAPPRAPENATQTGGKANTAPVQGEPAPRGAGQGMLIINASDSTTSTQGDVDCQRDRRQYLGPAARPARGV